MKEIQFPAGTIRIADANTNRIGEGLRVLEEAARFVLNDGVLSERLKNLRRLTRASLVSGIYGLYAVIDSDCLKGRNRLETTSQVLPGGVKLVQLRDKFTPKKRLYELAIAVKKLCVENEAIFIINDHMDIALAIDADGLHLGQDDIPVKIARRLLPVDKLIGCSVTTAPETKQAKDDGADYLACGAIYPTGTKTDCPVVGLDALGEIKRAVSLPLVAIGGINIENVAEVFAAGADSAAVVSALVLARSPALAAKEMLQRIEVCHEQT